MPQAQTVAFPKRIPLVVSPENRGEDTSKDARLVNAYVEKRADGEYDLYRRPGLVSAVNPSGGSAAGQGAYQWLGDLYSVFGGHLYKGTSTDLGAVNAANGVYRFVSCLGGTPKLTLGNGVKAYNYDSGAGLVEITDGDFPSAFRKGWAFLDGTTYIMTAAAAIQGDDINNPVSWDPLNTITAQIEPDGGIALAKQLVYVVALKGWTTEIFYDAANPTGSPLGTVQGAKQPYGCAHQDSVRSIDDTLLWLSTTREGALQVVQLENLKLEVISTKPVERLLAAVALTTVYSFTLKRDAHKFYVITFKDSNLTLAYDISEKMWGQWTDASGNYFPFVDSVTISTSSHYLQHESDGRLHLASQEYYTDNNSIITVDAITPNFDGGTSRRKMCGELFITGDRVAGSELLVRTNDFDYDPKKWTNFRTFDLGQTEPRLPDWGTYVKRATHIRHQKATAFRLQAVNHQIDLGTL